MKRLGLFSKFWQPGSVKTRLFTGQTIISDEAASQIYFRFLCHLVQQLSHCGDQRDLVFTPRERELEFRQLAGDHWGLESQSSGDLGRRMKTYFNRHLSCNEKPKSQTQTVLNEPRRSLTNETAKVVVIGADCPLINWQTILLAFESLERFPVVLGPSDDGGYYLIGMKQPHFQVFDSIGWSTDAVLAQTIDILSRHNVSYELLQPLYDVDQPEDLSRLMNYLKSASDPAEIELRKQIEKIMEQDCE